MVCPARCRRQHGAAEARLGKPSVVISQRGVLSLAHAYEGSPLQSFIELSDKWFPQHSSYTCNLSSAEVASESGSGLWLGISGAEHATSSRQRIDIASSLWTTAGSDYCHFSLRKLITISTYTRQKAKSKYRNRIQFEITSQKQSSDAHKTSCDRVKRCRERKINIKASERVNRWRIHTPSSTLSCVTGKVRGTPSSVSEEPSNEVKAIAGMPRRLRKAPYQHVSEFELGRMIGLRETEGRTQLRAGTGPRNVTTARNDRHLVRMAVTDHTASSTVLARHWSTATGVGLSASTVRRHLLQTGLVARIPLRRLPLSRNHKRLRLQWARERRRWCAEWQSVVFTDESRFNLSYCNGRIRVRR
ncbi:hypothetical protein PR048_002350 [Dryococelus australis]|uniref:Transposase Tc1-like domain-containing protein n=1 Tax=Dryococelus australis TaxID=614101 RepID=A0ABQ9IJX9_9NEOP|nr:hypothetical protein PR048_002350 [Dryococelus australis]